MGFVAHNIAGHRVLVFDGALDLSTLPRLSDIIAKQAEPGANLTLDLDGITVLDDAAVGIIIGCAARQRDGGGRVSIICTNPAIIERLERVGASGSLSIVSSVHDIA